MSAYRTTFLSHAHVDNAVCAQIANALRAAGVDLWIDLRNMQDGHALASDITLELYQRQAFVVVLTAASNASHWVGQELELFQGWKNDRQHRLVNGLERLLVPVVLEANLAMVVRDSETQQNRASNWAKLSHLKAIDGVGRPLDQVVTDIARAVASASTAAAGPSASPQVNPAPPLSVLPGEPAPTPVRLEQLGFEGRRIQGVEILLPPVVPVSAGPFTMGSDKMTDAQAYDDETPQYRIQVEAFEIGVYPVTVAEYALYLKANPNVAPPADFTYDQGWEWVAPAWRGKTVTWAIQQQQRFDHPVVGVTWENARNYTAWEAKVVGQPWRLPTEAEWEKAARGPDGRIYPWGNTWDARRANTQDGGPKLTTPIGQYASANDVSPYGCHDLVGNVWEWCSSYYRPYPYDRQISEQKDDQHKHHIIRGGSFGGDPRSARAAQRNVYGYDGSNVLGFRLVRARPGPG